MDEIKSGDIYRHSKTGKDYKIVAVGKHSETFEDYVVYECLHENKLSKIWVRPKNMFLETIILDRHEVPRYQKIN